MPGGCLLPVEGDSGGEEDGADDGEWAYSGDGGLYEAGNQMGGIHDLELIDLHGKYARTYQTDLQLGCGC